MIDTQTFPHLHLLVSGGNSQLILLQSWQNWEIVGQTLDDAAGECFDKCGRSLGLPYPAGVYLSRIARLNNTNYCNLPISMLGQKQADNSQSNLNYSFSGLKTAVRYLAQKQTIPDFEFEKSLSEAEIQELTDFGLQPNFDFQKLSPKLRFIYDVCCSVQSVIIKQLLNKIQLAITIHKPHSIGLSGGVSANQLLRQELQKTAAQNQIVKVLIPPLALSGDNAVMIALAGLAENYK